MADCTTTSLRTEFVADVEAHLEGEPFGSPKELIEHLVLRAMESEATISEIEARQIGRKRREIGYLG